MKYKVQLLATFVLAATAFLSCTPEEKEHPVTYIIKGPREVFRTATSDYEVVPAWDQQGTTWSWSATGASVQSVSADTKVATINFPTVPANGTAVITVSETTAEGIKAPDETVEVTVLNFCTLNLNDFIGTFNCDEAGYGVYPVNFTKHPTLANTIVNDNFWDWAAPGATIYYTFSGDFSQTINVPKQTFEFGDGYVGWVQGSGSYNACTKTMTVQYVVSYEGEEYDTYHTFTPAKKGAVYPPLPKKSRGNINL